MSTCLASLLRDRLTMRKEALVGRAAKFLVNAGKNAPGTTALTIGAGTVLGPAVAADALRRSPAKQRQKLERRAFAQQTRMRKTSMLKHASVMYSDDELQEAMALRQLLEKQAAKRPLSAIPWDDKGRMFMAGALLSAGAAAGGGTANLVSHLLGQGGEAVRMARQGGQYNRMIEVDPSLKEHPKSRAFFNVIQRASPYVAGEAEMAASTVRSMIEAPEGYAMHPKFVTELLGLEERRQKTKYPFLRAPAMRGELPDLD